MPTGRKSTSPAASPRASRPTAPVWFGEHVVWWGGDDWEFHTCVRCNGPLRSAMARKKGYGPNCAQVLGIESYVQQVLRAERAASRAAVAARQPVPAYNRATRWEQTGRAARRSYAASNKPTHPEPTPIPQPTPKPRADGPPPTENQHKYLRSLARQTGMTFVTPATRDEASTQIDFLKTRLK